MVFGDARNNYHASRSWVLKSIRQRACHLYWLNPEPAYTWNIGDSIVSEYARHCEKMVECRSPPAQGIRGSTEVISAK
jgi:uncharacterized protein with von Willebrand factor type A (vWA) domain